MYPHILLQNTAEMAKNENYGFIFVCRKFAPNVERIKKIYNLQEKGTYFWSVIKWIFCACMVHISQMPTAGTVFMCKGVVPVLRHHRMRPHEWPAACSQNHSQCGRQLIQPLAAA